MTKVLFYNKISDTKGRCYAEHNQPDKLTEEQKAQGVEVDSVPEKPSTGRGENAVRYVNPQTKEVWYEIETRELNDEEKQAERLDNLENRVKAIEDKI